MSEKRPSVDLWLEEAKADVSAPLCGVYLIHNGVVRGTSRSSVRGGEKNTPPVKGMEFDFNADAAARAVDEALKMPGIHYVRIWMNRGVLNIGDDLMLVLVGADIRPRAAEALRVLVDRLKNDCVTEKELF